MKKICGHRAPRRHAVLNRNNTCNHTNIIVEKMSQVDHSVLVVPGIHAEWSKVLVQYIVHNIVHYLNAF